MKFDSRYIFNAIFVSAMLILVVNDHVLKNLFGNVLTGKLSDVAGIIALPLFLSYFFPKHLKQNSILSALLFIFWKLPTSEPFIEWYNSFTPIKIERIVDYSDLLVLTILPIVYVILKRINTFRFKIPTTNRFAQTAVLITSIIAFMATSPPRSHYFTESSGNVRFNWSIKIDGTEKDAIQQLNDVGVSVRKDSLLIQQLENLTPQEYLEKKDEFHYYIIDNMAINAEIIKSVQFSFYEEKEGKPKLYLNAMYVEAYEYDQETYAELRKKYQEKIKRIFKDALQ